MPRRGFLSALPLSLLLALTVAYAPTLGAGALNYDDPWLLFDNPMYAPSQPLLAALRAIFFDLSRETRMVLGAEYLPLRDLLGVLELRVLRLGPEGMHVVSLALYGAALCLLRAALLRTFEEKWAVELGIVLFALHPVHVESVAWLAGQKDVLALVFVSSALWAHARAGRGMRVLVPLAVAAASLSKSMSVVVLFLLAAQDLVLRRRPDVLTYLGSVLAVAATLSVHLYVGSLVGMVAEPAGGTRYTAWLTMGPVWLRYLWSCLCPANLSVVYDVPALTSLSMASVAGYAFVAGCLALAWGLGRRRGLFLFAWFFLPLLPVSQVMVPLQHRMADRYLWLSVLAPCLLVGYAATRARRELSLRPRMAVALAAAPALVLMALTFERSLVFADSVLLFSDATLKTQVDGVAPYQLGKALEEAGRDEEAMRAFEEVLRRTNQDPHPQPSARPAANNLARLLDRHGQQARAEQVLRTALLRDPLDRKLNENLAKLLRISGRSDEADALLQGPYGHGR